MEAAVCWGLLYAGGPVETMLHLLASVQSQASAWAAAFATSSLSHALPLLPALCAQVLRQAPGFQHSWQWNAVLLAGLLQTLPALATLKLDVSTYMLMTLTNAYGLAFASHASRLRRLDLGMSVWPNAAAANRDIESLGQLSAMQQLWLGMSHPPPRRVQGAVRQPPLNLGPLGALSQLQRLTVYGMGKACLDLSSLCRIAAGCKQLTEATFQMFEWDLQIAAEPAAAGAAESAIPGGAAAAGGSGVPAAVGAASTAAAGASKAGGAAAGSGLWPSLRKLGLLSTTPAASTLFQQVFRSMPALVCIEMVLLYETERDLVPSELQALCSRLAALERPMELTLMFPKKSEDPAPAGQFGPVTNEPAGPMIQALRPLGSLLTELILSHALVLPRSVQELAETAGSALVMLDLHQSKGFCGSLALVAAEGLPGLAHLLLPQPLFEVERQASIIQACCIAQLSPERTGPLTIKLTKVDLGLALQAKWADQWAALPQPRAGPMRVTVTGGE